MKRPRLKQFVLIAVLTLLYNMTIEGGEKMVPGEGLIVDTMPDMERWGDGNREARQGVPSIEISPCGRLWAAFRVEYSRGQLERSVALVTSDDDGHTWSDPFVVLHDPEHDVSPFDPVLWHDPLGRLWFFWSQRPGFDVWGIVTEESGSENPVWSDKVRLMEGVMMNKPTVLSSGEWVFPATSWGGDTEIYVSTDKGESHERAGAAYMPMAIRHDEHMVVEREDKTLWMLVRSRTPSGIAQSFSEDRGKTWSEGKMYKEGPDTRFHIRRLSSGRLLLVYHHETDVRENLTAHLSEDNGETWPHQLLLVGKRSSYPDAVQAENGRIYVIYDTRGSDHEPEAEVQMATFKEEDIIAGEFITNDARSNVLINNNAR